MAKLCELMSKLTDSDIANIKHESWFDQITGEPHCPLATLGVKLGFDNSNINQVNIFGSNGLEKFFLENFGVIRRQFETFYTKFDRYINNGKLKTKAAIKRACKEADKHG